MSIIYLQLTELFRESTLY